MFSNHGPISSKEIADDAVITQKIAASAVTTAKINATAVTAAKIGTSAVTATKIAQGAVITTKIAASAVTTAKINATAVTAAKIAPNAVTTTKIAASAVTAAKLKASALDYIKYKGQTGATLSALGRRSLVTAGFIPEGVIVIPWTASFVFKRLVSKPSTSIVTLEFGLLTATGFVTNPSARVVSFYYEYMRP